MKFRPCIDIHDGVVKQIVGSTLKDAPAGSNEKSSGGLVTNFVATKSSAEFAGMYKADNLPGGHVIMLGSGSANVAAAKAALQAYPGGMQVGGE
jgi:phosphoribosylformimino-5-aminoimidazole carboxamide ribotide isomerase